MSRLSVTRQHVDNILDVTLWKELMKWRIQEPNSYRKAWKTSMNAIVSRWICNLTLRFKIISMHRGPCDKILAVEIINLGAHYIDQFLSMFRYDNIADALSSQLEQKIRVLLQLSNLLMKLAQL